VTLRATLVGLVLIAPLPAVADRLHLESGGVIETRSWWVEGDTLKYDTEVGTIGLPRALVIRIEETAASAMEATTTPAAATRTTRGGATDGGTRSKPGGTIRVPRELADLLREAKVALESGDNDTAALLYQRALAQSDADFNVPRIGYALSNIALDRDDAALSVVLDGLSHDPDQPALLELLGDLHNRSERVPDALIAWKSAFESEPNDRLRGKITKAERELEAGRDYSLTTSAHFNMRYDRHVDADLARSVTDYLEQQYWVLADRYRHTPPQPITVLLYPTREFRDVTQTPEWVGGIYDGKIRVPLGGLRRMDPRAEAVLVHELTHAVVHSKTRGRCPRWLHEGLAQLSENRPLPRSDRVRISETLAERDPARWADGGLSYQMALSLTMHLEARKGIDGLVRVLDRLGEGEELEAALVAVYGVSYERICRDWAQETAREVAG
jgi:tetratricopeptide (TPR) repeat protein